jgi:hypothetical protein
LFPSSSGCGGVWEGETQRVVVRAKYGDGIGRDVTRFTAFAGNNDTAATVTGDGTITATGPGETTTGKIAEGKVVEKLLAAQKDPPAVAEELYPRCLGRKPTPGEAERIAAKLARGADTHQALEDLFWALRNADGFIFTHRSRELRPAFTRPSGTCHGDLSH